MQRINVSDVARLLYLHAMHYQAGNTKQDQDYHQCQHHTRMEINIFAPKCKQNYSITIKIVFFLIQSQLKDS